MSRIVVTGAAGQVGCEVVEVARAAGHQVVGLVRGGPEGFDLGEPASVHAAIEGARPELIIHAAAWTAVDACEGDPDRALAVNGAGTAHVVAAADAVGAHVLYVSTDYVFDGTKTGPYLESDATNPASAYGRSKLVGEQAVLATGHAVARTAWVCGAQGSNMVKTVLRLAATQHRLSFVDDQVGSPTFTATLAPALLELGLLGVPGTFHVTNAGAVSWYGFAREVLTAAGLDPDRVSPIATADLQPPRPAPRPANSVLSGEALARLGVGPLPHFRARLVELVGQLRP